ncbi:MAG: hypothetical protein AAB227_08345 [Pseudomonadota bacterium]
MRKFLARIFLDRFSARYDYDMTYMREMLAASPDAFFRFANISSLARHREAAPIGAYFAAKLVGAMVEDCGPCTQLVVAMAREAGVANSDISAVLEGDMTAASESVALGFRFADALTRDAGDLGAARDAVRARWGEKGVIDLTFGAQISRVFPMVKRGLGHAQTCERVRVGDRAVSLRKIA